MAVAEPFRFADAVSAVSPLDGDAIDGSARPKPRRSRKSARDYDANASRTFFCSNPQCDHDTWSPVDQARHMAQEFWWVTQAIVRIAPDSPEAIKLTGGVVLRDLSDDECRAGDAEYARLWRGRAETVPTHVRLLRNEYSRRRKEGLLSPPAKKAPAERCSKGHPWTEENTQIRSDGSRKCRQCMRERSARPENRAKAAAYMRDYYERNKDGWNSEKRARKVQQGTEARRRRRESDPDFRLRDAARKRLRYAEDPDFRARVLAANRRSRMASGAADDPAG